MLTIAIVSTLGATAMLIATAVAYHIEAGDARREKALSKNRGTYLRGRGI